MLNLIPSQYKLIAAGAAVLALMALSATGAWQWQANSYERQLSELRGEYAEAARQAEARARSEEQRRQTAIEGIRRDAQDKIAAVAADAAAADDAASRLRARVAQLSSRPASCPGAAGGGEATDETGMVLTDVFARLDQRAGELAEAYDRARIAGLACETAYDALKGN
ncbi:DUF2514 domain-containing protein [Pseudomonas sp. Choline-3u-10]|uniref:DUF2514 domain-containing protein n=1 Tax=viral metagenome TaxID=1070528 RepID=A0A6H1ZK75_9ZZZZ|nr:MULTISPECIES: DUF2514 family protein [Pseudomonadaceae]MBK3797550.1 DUF2514 family protein [Stutzerimonas stutzeri]MBK3876389.1 DUF2514 family protein [Stutzerimonas stutzeri]PKG90903.1 DUF2514 domain-containing protein [Pseudomonas sp. Choline-3u-10]|tara:strand:- start:133 stop:636 length:504 start_codon:yes stop_codon:yes gene_type:complete